MYLKYIFGTYFLLGFSLRDYKKFLSLYLFITAGLGLLSHGLA